MPLNPMINIENIGGTFSFGISMRASLFHLKNQPYLYIIDHNFLYQP